MKLAAIDVGSNSIHMVIVRRSDDGRIEVIDRVKDMVRLASGALEKAMNDGATARGSLAPDRFDAGLACIRKFAKLAERHACDAIIAAATSAVREAENGGDFIAAVQERTGITINVLPAGEEARLIYLAAREAVDLQGRRALFVDIGGGSVELTVGDTRRSYVSESLKLGVIRLAERFLKSDPPTAKERAELEAFVEREAATLATALRQADFTQAVGTSGTILALAEVAAWTRGDRAENDDSALEQLTPLSLEELAAINAELSKMPERERAKIPGVGARRAATIVAGGLLLEKLFRMTGARSITPCDRALREGLVIDYFEKNRDKLKLLDEHRSPRERSVFDLARRSGYDRAHALHVMRLSRELFDQLRSVHGLKARDRELLEYGAVLHDVGQSISFARHHKHSYYLIRNADLRGFDAEEIEVMALLARYHRKGTPSLRHESYRALSAERRKAVSGMAALLRVADALDRSHFQVCAHVTTRVSEREVRLRVLTIGDAEIEVWTAARKGDLFEEVFDRRLRVEVEARPERVTRPLAAAVPGPLAP
jgi:exopolyphosphatase/guanosine-5'-triphosphate,3'-diphosphate pyrophosphatase